MKKSGLLVIKVLLGKTGVVQAAVTNYTTGTVGTFD